MPAALFISIIIFLKQIGEEEKLKDKKHDE